MTPKQDLTDQERAESLSRRFNAAAKKSCGATLEMAETIFCAHQELKDGSLATFYELIGRTADASKARKLKRIGEYAQRFRSHIDRLPDAWTTLYELTKLEADEFQRLMDSDAAHPLATWDDLKAVLGKGKKKPGPDPASKPIRLYYHFDVSQMAALRRQEFVKRLNELCAAYEVACEPTPLCEALLKTFANDDAVVPNGTNDNQETVDEAV